MSALIQLSDNRCDLSHSPSLRAPVSYAAASVLRDPRIAEIPMSKYTPIEPAGAHAVDEMRDAARKRVLMRATIISAAGAQAADVKDLTSSGARIRCDRRLEEGWDVIFNRGEVFVAARVAWASRDGAGLQFYREIPPAALHA